MISLSTEFCTLAYFIVLVLKCLIHYLEVECPPYNIVISLCEGVTSAGNNFSYLTGHVSFQISILAGDVTTLVGH